MKNWTNNLLNIRYSELSPREERLSVTNSEFVKLAENPKSLLIANNALNFA